MLNIQIDHTLYAQWLVLALKKEWDPLFRFLEKNPRFIYDIVGVRLKDPNPNWSFLEIAFLQGDKSVITRLQALLRPYRIGVFTRNDEVIQEIIVSFGRDYVNWLIDNDCIPITHVGPTGKTLMEYLQMKQSVEDKLEIARLFSIAPNPALFSQVNWSPYRRTNAAAWPIGPAIQEPDTAPSNSLDRKTINLNVIN